MRVAYDRRINDGSVVVARKRWLLRKMLNLSFDERKKKNTGVYLGYEFLSSCLVCQILTVLSEEAEAK
jgi:hypothetical protein